MRLQRWIMLFLLLFGLSACAPILLPSTSRYHVSGWGYTTGYPMFTPRTEVYYPPAPNFYGVTRYYQDGY